MNEDIEIIDIQNLIQKSEDYLNRTLKDLDLSKNDCVYIENYRSNPNHVPVEFDDFLKKCKLRFDKFPAEVGYNCFMMLNAMKTELLNIKKDIESDFRDIVREIENIDSQRQTLIEENTELKDELDRKDELIKELETEKNIIEKQTLQHRIDFLYDVLRPQIEEGAKKVDVHKHFDDEVLKNVAKENELELPMENKNHDRVESYVPEVVVSTGNQGVSDEVQKCHKKIIDRMKGDKDFDFTSPEEFSTYYKSVWNMICYLHSLDEKDMPEFVEHIDKFQGKPLEYFEDLNTIEKRWENE